MWHAWRWKLPDGRLGTAFREDGAGGAAATGVFYSFDDGPLVRKPHIPQIGYLDNDLRKTLAALGSVPGGEEPRIAFEKPQLLRGQYHPRIWRQPKAPGLAALNTGVFSLAVQAFRSLYGSALDVFSTIEPDPRNASAFGHKIREVLILACTEVEAAWAAVLLANGVQPARFSTIDYVKLLPALRLDEWELELFGWPASPALRPFDGWTAAQPTQSLPWYNAYNATKHDRENHFPRATLEQMIRALAAAYVMLEAQFGAPSAYDGAAIGATPFAVRRRPDWPLLDQYVPPFTIPGHAETWNPINYTF